MASPAHSKSNDKMMSRSDVTNLVDRVFCSSSTAHYGPYKRLDDGAVLLSGLLHRYKVVDMSDVSATLQIFSGLGEIGGQLWEQEIRVLLRISAVGHPALPRIIDGSYDEKNDIAFVVTEASDYTLDNPEAIPFLHSQRAECVRHLGLLADALAILHGQGLMHRNLWPGAVDIIEEDHESGKLRLRLARFEMSVLIGNLLRRVTLDTRQNDDEIRRLFVEQGPRALAYFPPERMAFLFTDGQSDMLETDRSDVYGLGVLAWEWFVGPLPGELLRGQTGSTQEIRARAADIRTHMEAEITRSKLPARFQDLLRGMLDPDPRTRLTSSQVVEEITRRYDAFVAPWESTDTDSPHLVAFMPRESRTTVYEWQWIDHDPGTPEGRTELAGFLETELRGAEIVYSQDGADLFVPGENREAKRKAKYVLQGRRGSWFCTLFENRTPFRSRNQTFENVLLIKYVAARERTRRLDARTLRRRISCIEAIPWDIGRLALDQRRSNRPSWRPVLEAIRAITPRPQWHASFERAFDWFLDLQEVELLARRYPFVRCSHAGQGSRVRLRFDEERDQRHIAGHRTALFALFASSPSRRPSFGDFFDGLESVGTEAAILEFFPDKDGRPDWRQRSGTAFVTKRLDDSLIEIKLTGGSPPVPETGWMRPKDDSGSEQALKRQRDARLEFLDARSLLAQLHSPSAIRGFRHRWRGVAQDLRGGADTIVKDMLVSQAFYALHGPPGTGKTTVAAHAVEAYLHAERGARILVSAQSNYALDNLALRIRKQLSKRGLTDILAVRISSRSGEAKVHPSLADWKLDQLVLRRVQSITAHCTRRLDRRADPEPLRRILGLWKDAVKTSHLELQDRIRRGSNLVFATCTMATKRNVDAVGSFGVYDWVLVEEAGKAWPTELAIPLVRGVRWTLIGDHRQLPAHRRREVEDLLLECAEAGDEDLRNHGVSRESHSRIFDLFGSLFEHDISQMTRKRSYRSRHRLTAPLGKLTLQFRMRRPIAEVISRAFYPSTGESGIGSPRQGTLETDPETEIDSGLCAPEKLVGRALVWLDTGDMVDCVDEPRWANRGEANIVADLLKVVKPPLRAANTGSHEDTLAILTPYRDQIDMLARIVPEYSSRFFSVHEFQGREADIVVASLVRDKVRGNNPRSNLGHLIQPELVNVLFSRARHLLVIIGHFQHFHESGVTFWQLVCETIRQEGLVVRADAVVSCDGGR